MSARLRFSILESSGRVHAKVYDRRGRSSERERRSHEAQGVQAPAAQMPDREPYIMPGERCEVSFDDKDVACGCAGFPAMHRDLTSDRV